MPSDVHRLSGKKEYIDSPDIIAFVRGLHPKATAEGSCGSWSFMVDGKLIAEAWMHATRPGWWLRRKI